MGSWLKNAVSFGRRELLPKFPFYAVLGSTNATALAARHYCAVTGVAPVLVALEAFHACDRM